jgi:hypothetical protein
VGLWSAEEKEESSNYKELRNLVDTVSEEERAGRMRDCELFLFTNNSTAEGCFIGLVPNCATFMPWWFICALSK